MLQCWPPGPPSKGYKWSVEPETPDAVTGGARADDKSAEFDLPRVSVGDWECVRHFTIDRFRFFTVNVRAKGGGGAF